MRDWPTEIEAGLIRARVCQHRAQRWVRYTQFAIFGSLIGAAVGVIGGWLWITAFYLLNAGGWLFFLRSWRRSLVFWRVMEGQYLKDREKFAVKTGYKVLRDA